MLGGIVWFKGICSRLLDAIIRLFSQFWWVRVRNVFWYRFYVRGLADFLSILFWNYDGGYIHYVCIPAYQRMYQNFKYYVDNFGNLQHLRWSWWAIVSGQFLLFCKKIGCLFTVFVGWDGVCLLTSFAFILREHCSFPLERKLYTISSLTFYYWQDRNIMSCRHQYWWSLRPKT